MAVKIIQPEDWTPDLTGYYSIDLASQLFELQSASKSYTITVPEDDVIRFELRDGDQHWWDAQENHTTERAELADRATIANGTPMHISYEFNLEPGEPNTAYFMVLGQLHQEVVAGQEVSSPPFQINLIGEKLAVYIGYTNAAGERVTKPLFIDVADINRGHNYDFDIKTIIDPSGNGRLVVTLDGVTIVDYSGPLGYVGDNAVYWAEGIYRHSNATETVAATYGHLAIETGDTFTIPSSDEFIAAPQVTLDDIGYPANGDHVVTLSGTAKAGTTVSISEDGVVIGTAFAGTNGRFTLDVILTTDGAHDLSAVAIDSSGRKGITAAPMTIEISTAADIVARMDEIAANTGLAAIILTDTQVLTVESAFQMRVFLNYTDTMDKIEGKFTFQVNTAITGQTGYNRQEETYNSSGVLIERERFSGNTLVYDEKIGADGITTVTTWKTNGTSDFSVVDHGRVVSYSQFDASGALLSKQLYFADGTKEIDNYNPVTGDVTNSTFYNLDGSRILVVFGITGQAYVETATTYDKAGKQVLLERFDADGTKIFSRTWTADGAMYTHNYDPATGKEISYSLTEADGTHVEATFGISGQTYSGQILHYDKNWVMTERERLDGAGHLLSTETFGTGASLKVYTYNASFGLTGYTLYAADKSFVTITYAAGSETKIAQQAIYDTHGTLVETLLYDANGVVFAHLAGGTSKVYTLNSAGVATGSITTATDGSYIVTKFVAGHEELPTSANKYTATGWLYETDTFNASGQFIKAEIRHTDGSKELHNYDPLTHVETGYTITYADKSREEANLAVTGKDYAQQITDYNSAGVVVEMIRKYGDAANTTSFHQKLNTDGSSEVHIYDTRGRETNETLTAADHSRDSFNYSYTGTATSATTVQQTHYTTASVKQWVDITKADGSHLQTSYSDGAHLISHAGVRDVFAGLSTGNDTFEFDAGFGKDTIMGFQAGTGAVHDTIEFDIAVVADYADLLTMMTKQGADTLITINANDTIVIKDVNPATLTEHDFTFVDHSASWQV